MDREIGARRMRLKSWKGRFSFEVHKAAGISSKLCVDGADVLCHMYEALCTLPPGAVVRVEKLRVPVRFE